MSRPTLDDAALDLLFRQARSYNRFSGEVSEADLRRIYDLMKWGPTAVNACPLRMVFLRSDQAKRRLEPLLSESNRAKAMSGPVVAVLGNDLAFAEKLALLFPHTDAKAWFAGSPREELESFGMRSGSLQAAYFILAARACGLDCGPMTGYDHAAVTREFFAGTEVVSNMVIALGVGDPASIFPRSPRLSFDEACRIE